MDHEGWMRHALALADEAAAAGEVPVGCVIVRGDRIIGRGRNRREEERSALAHAEIDAIREACAALGDWRLGGCGLYVTLEPCPMCAGAILNARLKWLCFGARDPKTGSCGSVLNLFEENYGYRPAIYGGILEAECLERLQAFFRGLRETD
jgi:tRNA(adenine34) deaminase